MSDYHSYNSQLPPSAYGSSSSSSSSYSSPHHPSSSQSYSSQLPPSSYSSPSPSPSSYSSQLPQSAYSSSSSSYSSQLPPSAYSSSSSSQQYSSQLPPSAYSSDSYSSHSSDYSSSQSSYSSHSSDYSSPQPSYSSQLPPSAYSSSYSSQLPPSAYSHSSPPPSSGHNYSSQIPSSAYSPSSPPSYSPPPSSSSSSSSSSYSSQLPSSAYSNAKFPPRTSPKRAVLVGINYMGNNEARLNGCVNDAAFMKYLLITKFGYNDKNIVVLTDDTQDSSRRPTRANIIAALTWLGSEVRPGDSLFFSFSGHGSQTADLDGDEADGKDETILPEDYKLAGPIVDDDLHRILAAPLPTGAKLTCLMDCCHSGTGLDLPYIYSNGRLTTERNAANKATRGDAVLFSACSDSQTSQDSRNLSQVAFSGVLTYAFCQSIESAPHLTYTTLLQTMQKFSATKGFMQTIQLSSGKQFDLNTPFSP